MSSAPQNLLPILQADLQAADQSVAGPGGPGYCSYIDVQSILNITFTSSSVPNLGTVNDLIVRSSSYVDQVSSHDWNAHKVTEYYDALGSGARAGTIVLRHRPLLSVQEVSWWYGGILAWMPGFWGYPQQVASVTSGPSTILDQFQTTVPANQLMQPQTYLIYFPEGKIQWNTMRLDDRLRYRVIYTYGYTVPPDFIRDLASTVVAIDILTFWGSQLGIAEDSAMMKKRLEEKKFRLEARASQRPAAAVG